MSQLAHKYIAKQDSIPLVLYVHNISGKKIDFGLFAKNKPSGIIVIPEYPDDKILDYLELVTRTNKHNYQLGLIKVECKDLQHLIRPVAVATGSEKMPLLPFRKLNTNKEDEVEIPCDIAFGNGEDLEYVLDAHTVVKFSIYPSEIKPKN